LGTTATANTFASTEIYIPNYTSTTSKSVSIDGVTENNATTSYQTFTAGLSTLSTAITSVSFGLGAGNFVQYSTFSLYGLAAVGTTPVIAPKASGGSIYNDGTYWYHAFRTSGTFTPQTALTADVLVIAGGGGGGSRGSGLGGEAGGGAGGFLGFNSQPLTATSYTCTIGAGGAATSTARGATGTDSQFGALTLVKGGGGGANRTVNTGLAGGSGGGGSFNGGAGGAATSGQGFAGGNGSTTTGNAAGGGGAGAAAANSTSGPTAGGIGLNTYSSWATATITGVSGYYAGGGGGSGVTGSGEPGGTGGGGAGGGSGNGTAGTINTGGGGGGGNTVGGDGGSGLLIIRYTIA
jgi:hypothetical protein